MKTTHYGLYGLLLRSIPCFLSVVPSIIALEGHTWPLLILWTVCGVLRCYYHDPKIDQDCLIFGIVNIFLLREAFLSFPSTEWKDLNLSDATAKHKLSIFGLTILAAILATAFLFGGYITSTKKPNSKHALAPGFREYTPPRHLKTLILPCRTTHTRVFPKLHTFVYSYLLYGVPIFPKAIGSDGAHKGFYHDSKKGKWWLQVRAEDYLQRGYGEHGLYEKLKMALRDQGVQDSEWLYGYLVTAPRFFGYSFNPVSFWYIYDEQHELKHMLLEVNNTFGERRLYVLHGSRSVKSPESSSSETSTSDLVNSSEERFIDNWPKDFHVSPFNSRKGAYSLKALNPFPYHGYEPASIDNTITLSSSKEHAKIVARVYSTGPPLDPDTLGILGTMRFVGGWFWVGFSTSPRIMKEAFKLYFRRSLNVWLRPEVLSSSIGRAPTPTERALHDVFRSYLHDLISRSTGQWNICFHTAMSDRPKDLIVSTCTQGDKFNPKMMEIRVLNPSFYSRFLHYAYMSEAFDRECLFTDKRNRTLEISHPEFLSLLLPTSKQPLCKKLDQTRTLERTWLEELRWETLRYLRCPPSRCAYPETPNANVTDIRFFPYSDMDNFVRRRDIGFDAGLYRRTVTKVFLAQRFCFGIVEVIDLLDMLVRVCLCYVWSSKLVSRSPELEQHILDRTVIPDWRLLSGLGIGMCACHIYGLVKGYR